MAIPDLKSSHTFGWKRFWYPRGKSVTLDGGGYLADPDSPLGVLQNPDAVPSDALADIPCLVLLGEPGMGKSRALEAHRATIEPEGRQSSGLLLSKDLKAYQSDSSLHRAVFEDATYRRWLEGDQILYLFLDSVDECLIRIDTLSAFLADALRNSPAQRLRLRIASRAAEWPRELEDFLKAKWGKEAVGIYELAPLRKIDVVAAAAASGVDDPESFLVELQGREATSLAIKPITLRFLLNSYLRSRELPRTQASLYRQGCRLLCEESSDFRRRITTLDAEQRLMVAARIAAVAIFCKRTAIWTGLDVGDVPPEEVTLGELAGGSETVGGAAFRVTESSIREVLSTGLFSHRGEERRGFAHQTYAEFLAALYVHHRRMSEPQVMSLILHPDDPGGRVVPQLQEAAAWLVGLDRVVFQRMMQGDPQVLLKSDVATADDRDREALLAALLHAFDHERLSDHDWDERPRYRKLDHPRLAEQLAPYVRDRTKGPMVRRFAIDVAEACKATSLLPLLADVALDPVDNQSIRERAVWAVIRFGDFPTKQRMRPLLAGSAGDDPDDELKGLALIALWPESLTFDEALAPISAPKRVSHGGALSLFLNGPFVEHLSADDLPKALAWAKEQAPKSAEWHAIDSLMTQLLKKSIAQVETPGVIEGFVQLAAERSKAHEAIFGRWDHDHVAGLLSEAARRRRIVEVMVPALVAEEFDPWQLAFESPRLVQPEDVFWMIERLEEAENNRLKRGWATLIQTSFDVTSALQIDAILAAVARSEVLENVFRGWLKPVELHSESARVLRDNYRRASVDPEGDTLDPPFADRIETLLTACESRDLDAWWRINLTLTWSPTSPRHADEYEVDLTVLPGWSALNEPTRARIIETAKRYILDFRAFDYPSILSDDYNHRPTLAGYRALRLLDREQPQFVVELDPEIWERWAPVVVGYPASSSSIESEPHARLVGLAYKHAPERVIEMLLLLIDKQNEGRGWLDVPRSLACCWDDRLESVVLAKAHDDRLKAICQAQLLEPLLDRKVSAAKMFAESLLSQPRSSEDTHAILTIASLLLNHAEDGGWSVVWPAIQKEAALGRQLMASLAARDWHAGFVRNISEESGADLYLWLSVQFPHTDDPRENGFHKVSDREQIAFLREAVLRQLQSRGTPAALRAVIRIAAALPELKWLKQAEVEAALNTLRHTWVPPRPVDLLAMARDADRRFVESGSHLLDLVIESIGRLEEDLQGETPGAPDVWDELRPGGSRPKDENRLSDYIARHLRRDLKGRAIVVNREVEIRRGEGIKGVKQGERTDIHVAARLVEADSGRVGLLTVIIEVKGCWNRELRTAMQAQLRDRYLKDNPCRHGLYLVGWFVCPQWEAGDARRERVPFPSQEGAREAFFAQAARLSNDDVTIRAAVLNASLR